MSLSVHFHGAADGDDGPFQLASASGWTKFGAYAGSLPPRFRLLQRFAADGEARDTATLASQLGEALETFPAEDEDVEDTAGQLLEHLGVGHPDETATVTGED